MKSLERLIWAVALIFVISLSSTVTIFALSSTITPTWSGGIWPGAPSYTVWVEGNNYFAKNASGANAYSGTVFSSVLESAIGDASDIYIVSGTYYTDGIEINVTRQGVSIHGAGKDTKIVLNSGTTKSVFVIKAPNFRLEDLSINSTVTNPTAGAAIAVTGVWAMTSNLVDRVATVNVIRNILIENTYEGIRFDNGTRQVDVTNVDIRNVFRQALTFNNASFIHVDRVYTFNWARQYNYSVVITYGFSLYFYHSEFLAARLYGVLSNPGSGVTNAWIYFTDCAVETKNSSIDLGEGYGFVFTNNQGGVNEGIYLHHIWACSSKVGVVFDGVINGAIDGDSDIHGNDEDGIHLQDTALKGVKVSENHVDVNSRAHNNNTSYADIWVDDSVGNFTIENNISYGGNYMGETTVFSAYAIYIGTSCDNFIVTGNLASEHGRQLSINNTSGTSATKVEANNIDD